MFLQNITFEKGGGGGGGEAVWGRKCQAIDDKNNVQTYREKRFKYIAQNANQLIRLESVLHV